MKIKVSPAVGGAAVAVSSLLFLWIATTEGVPETLGRYGITARSIEWSGIPGSEVVGLRRHLRGESYGAGSSDLTTGRFIARRGQELVLDYDLSITRGMVRVSLNRVPVFKDELWAVTVRGDEQAEVRLPIQRTGLYQLSVTHFGYTGTYQLAWTLE